jgi:hypothetical protein
MSSVIGFIIFYVAFLGFVFFMETQAGLTHSMSGYNEASFNQTESSFLSLFNISSGYGLVNILLLIPAIAVSSYIVLCWIRGVSP